MTTDPKPAGGWPAELPELVTPPIRRYLSDLARRVRGATPPPDPGPADVDPATPENRKALAVRLLLGAIRRYEETSREWEAIHESFPVLDPPRQPWGPPEVEERARWRTLLKEADENFNNAELNLAERIHVLFAMLDPDGRGGPREEPEYFAPRAVRHGGNVYVLAYSSYEYEPKTNIVSVYREAMALDLAEAPASDAE